MPKDDLDKLEELREENERMDGYHCPVCGSYNSEYGFSCGCYEEIHQGGRD